MQKKIEKYLFDMRKMIINGCKIILSNREKNMFFCESNDINYAEIKNILLNLGIKDFCKILDNRSLNRYEKLYLFSPIININNKIRNLYLKINMILKQNVIVLVSFHESKYYLKKRFESSGDIHD